MCLFQGKLPKWPISLSLSIFLSLSLFLLSLLLFTSRLKLSNYRKKYSQRYTLETCDVEIHCAFIVMCSFLFCFVRSLFSLFLFFSHLVSSFRFLSLPICFNIIHLSWCYDSKKLHLRAVVVAVVVVVVVAVAGKRHILDHFVPEKS